MLGNNKLNLNFSENVLLKGNSVAVDECKNVFSGRYTF